MRYCSILILFLIFISCDENELRYSDDPEKWTFSAGGKFSDGAEDVYVDDEGNIYACGSFSDVLKYSDGVIRSKGNTDIVLLKLNRYGKIQYPKICFPGTK